MGQIYTLLLPEEDYAHGTESTKEIHTHVCREVG